MDTRSAHDEDTAPRGCPLCDANATRLYLTAEGWDYYLCEVCRLIHVPTSQHPSRDRERARYDLHRNSPDDPGYRRFLGQLADAIARERIPPGRGLDIGCGPADVLADLLRGQGWTMAVYDPFYRPEPGPLDGTYDLVTCTEVVEHFRDPAREWRRLAALVRPGGWLGIMTSLWSPGMDFRAWRYRRDETHLCFYNELTLRWLAVRHGFDTAWIASPVALFRRQNSSAMPSNTTG